MHKYHEDTVVHDNLAFVRATIANWRAAHCLTLASLLYSSSNLTTMTYQLLIFNYHSRELTITRLYMDLRYSLSFIPII